MRIYEAQCHVMSLQTHCGLLSMEPIYQGAWAQPASFSGDHHLALAEMCLLACVTNPTLAAGIRTLHCCGPSEKAVKTLDSSTFACSRCDRVREKSGLGTEAGEAVRGAFPWRPSHSFSKEMTFYWHGKQSCPLRDPAVSLAPSQPILQASYDKALVSFQYLGPNVTKRRYVL